MVGAAVAQSKVHTSQTVHMPTARRMTCRSVSDSRDTRSDRLRALRVVSISWALVGTTPCAWAVSSFEACAKQVATLPAVYESYRCYFEVASRSGEWEKAGSHLEALAAMHPENDWIVFARGLVASPLDNKAAERLYAESAQRFETAGNIRGEVLARANLQSLFYQSGRIASAAREVERVTLLAERAQDTEVRIRARIIEAQFFINTVSNLGRAHRALQQA